MQVRIAFACALCIILTLRAPAQSPNPREVVTTKGIVTRENSTWWQVRLSPGSKVRIAEKPISTLRFRVEPFTEDEWWDGKRVEIAGQIDPTESDAPDRGMATITLYSMTLAEDGSTPLAETLRSMAEHEFDPYVHAPGQPLYRFAYYLVLLDPPQSCERCYVPLLVSPDPFEDDAVRKDFPTSVVSITTYERDSIWQRNGLALITPDAIDPKAHAIRFRGRNYRYEPVRDVEVLHLLEHPLGTIAISRPLIPQVEAPGAGTEDLMDDFHAIFRVRELHHRLEVIDLPKADGAAPTSASETGSSMSELTVFEDGKVEYRREDGCSNTVNPAELQKSHIVAEDWNWRETCPTSAEKHFEYSLGPAELSSVKELLDQNAVKQFRDFYSATAGSGNYSIEIPRRASTQRIPVMGFMPPALRERPALTYLICKAKEISQKTTKEPLPSWCSGLPPLR